MQDPGVSKRQSIVHAAAQCFQEKGYVLTTLNDIADAVHLQKPTLYHYVENKNELLFLVLQNTADLYNRTLELIAMSEGPATEKLDRAIRQHISLQLHHPGSVTIFRDAGELESPYDQDIRQSIKRYRDLLQGIIRQGMIRGEFSSGDPSMMALYVLGAMNFVHRWYQPDGARTIEEIGAFYSHSLLKTLVIETR